MKNVELKKLFSKSSQSFMTKQNRGQILKAPHDCVRKIVVTNQIIEMTTIIVEKRVGINYTKC